MKLAPMLQRGLASRRVLRRPAMLDKLSDDEIAPVIESVLRGTLTWRAVADAFGMPRGSARDVILVAIRRLVANGRIVFKHPEDGVS